MPVTPKSSTVPLSRASITNLQSQQRRVLLATVNIAVVPGARALGTGEAHFDRQRGVVVDYDDFGRVAVISERATEACAKFVERNRSTDWLVLSPSEVVESMSKRMFESLPVG